MEHGTPVSTPPSVISRPGYHQTRSQLVSTGQLEYGLSGKQSPVPTRVDHPLTTGTSYLAISMTHSGSLPQVNGSRRVASHQSPGSVRRFMGSQPAIRALRPQFHFIL